MVTQEVRKDEWPHFMDEFSRLHRDEIASVEVIGPDLGLQPEAQSLPFVGITAEKAGSEKDSIALFLGTEPEDHVSHRISEPIHLWLKSAEDRMRDALEIEAADGTKTILKLEPAEMPR
jgi:hypothetical protein